MDGIVVLLKPSGMTSHDCVYALRKISGQKRIGHSGTLDPNACGVLPLFIGKATRLIEYTEHATKSYRCEMLLGLVTDTQDIWGTVLEDNRTRTGGISQKDVTLVLSNFLGSIEQIPPQYSAIKVNGKRLYSYAREGIAVEVNARSVTVNHIELLNFNENTGRVLFDIECSKGTYVRTICNDAGKILGCGACMSFLLRTSTSGFSLAESKTLQELSAMTPESFENELLAPSKALDLMERVQLSSQEAALFLNGNMEFQINLTAPTHSNPNESPFFAMFFLEKFLGVAEYKENREYKPVKVFK